MLTKCVKHKEEDDDDMKGREDATGGLSLLSARGWQISSYLGSSSICSAFQMMITISWYHYHYFNYYHYYHYLTDFLLSWVVFDLFCFSDDDNIMIWDEMMAMVMMEMVLLMVVMVFMLIFSTKKENDAQCSFWHWKWRGTEKNTVQRCWTTKSQICVSLDTVD